ncbi:Mini-chromosome maintenance complex-binding protein [Schistosoma japonicum]|nr:Mini-chromosome maintenance complex-binding protein [Schistosoma japonicum]
MGYDYLTRPLLVFDHIHGLTEGCDKLDFPEEIRKILLSRSCEVPLFGNTSLERIPDGHLVRLVGMVQDMFNTELYMDEFRMSSNDSLIRSLRYRDFICFENCEDICPVDVKFAERQSFYIIPVPGESPWVKEIRVKENEYTSPIAISGHKRRLNEPTDKIPKKAKYIAMESNSVQIKFRKHFPLVEEENNDQKIGALLRVYSSTVQTQLKINDIIEVYGILEHARLCDALPEDSCEVEEKCNEPLPRVHAIIVHPLTHNNPLVHDDTSTSNNYDEIRSIRIKLMKILTTLFSGDEIVAEYVLLHLVSTRLATDSPYPNHLPAMNIHSCCSVVTKSSSSGIDSFSTDKHMLVKLYNRLHSFLPQLVTHLATIELTVKSLNDGPILFPVRDMNKGHLNPGRLQLPQGTEILVNETEMDSGQLQQKGLLNFQALNSVAINQRLSYDFQFYTQDWDTNLRVLILSVVPSLIKSVLSLPWQPQAFEDVDNNVNSDISECEWNDMRKYLTVLSISNEKYSMDLELQERINQDFVQWRRNKTTYIEADEFATMLCLLRFHCLTWGLLSPTLEHWLHIVELECKRKSRTTLCKSHNS